MLLKSIVVAIRQQLKTYPRWSHDQPMFQKGNGTGPILPPFPKISGGTISFIVVPASIIIPTDTIYIPVARME